MLPTAKVPQIQFVAPFEDSTGLPFRAVMAAMKGDLTIFPISRAPLGCPGVERQFLEPSMAKSSLSSRAPLHNS